MADPADSQMTAEPGAGKPDVIFIGAGINALAGAVLLGQAGWRTLVLERNDEPGGAVRTQELTLPGFRHELGAMNLNPFIGSPFYETVRTALAAKGVTFVAAHNSSGILRPDGGFLSVTSDAAANRRAIAEISEADADAWQVWTEEFDRCAPHLFRILDSLPGATGPLAQIFCDTDDMPAPVRLALRDILLRSLRETLTERFASDAVQAMIAAWGLHFDYAPDVAGGCWYPFIETNLIERAGATFAKGGNGHVTAALAELVSDHGGAVRTGQAVERIVVEDGRAVGVRLRDGAEIRASRAVVAGITPTALLGMAGDHLPAPTKKAAQAYRYGPGALLIHLALASPPDWKAAGARDCLYIHNGESLDHLAAVYQQAVAGLLSAEPFFCINQPSPYDPSLAPAGKQVMRIFVRAVPAVIRGDVAGTIRGETWTEAVKRAYADRVLDLIEAHAPGLRDRILGMAIQSPLDLEAENPNLVHGDNNAGSMQFGQFYGGRPFGGMTDHRTPIPGLYLCGAATWPGGGSSPASGSFAVQQILEDNA